jgi:DNA-binding NarL/FixJ family response regulator
VRAICSSETIERRDFTANAWAAALRTGNMNALVSAYRGSPQVLADLSLVAESDRLTMLLCAANDSTLAKRFGIRSQATAIPSLVDLTPREAEVMDMVAAGLSNKEIAQALFVVEATVKAHLRHAYEKLGVRGRPEAIAHWLTRQ